MSLLVVLKLVHILAAIVAVGANVTYAFWLRRAGRDREKLLYTLDGISKLDSRVANPAYIVVLLTGIGMVAGGLYSFSTGWVMAAIGLYIVVAVIGIFLYGPALRRQATEAAADPTSAAYAAAEQRANILGLVTIVVVVVIVWLMVTKPF